MDAMSVKDILRTTGGELLSGSEDETITGLCQDSREYKQGDMFVAVLGEVVDGHRFLKGVEEQGCKVFLVSDREAAAVLSADSTVILVEDTVAALRPLTRYYLQECLNVGRISVTGSVGKTSTRDMVYRILSQRYRTGRPIKNYNSDVGLPLTVAGFSSDLEMAVLEEGTDHFGDIHRLSDMARPEVAIITNIGISHMEFLGSREGILKAKMEIADYFTPDCVLIVNSDNDLLKKDDIQRKFNTDYRIITVGTEGGEDYHISDIQDRGIDGTRFTLTTAKETATFDLPIPGAHNCLNAGLAIAACQRYDLTMEEAARALSEMELTGKRLKVREGHGVKVLDDSYNAAPDSVKAAISVMEHSECKRRVAILGAMNELGEETPRFHYETGQFAAEHGVELLIGIEPKAKDIVKGAQEHGCEAIYYEVKEDLYPDLADLIKEGDLVLTKASMTRHFWEIADKIINE